MKCQFVISRINEDTKYLFNKRVHSQARIKALWKFSEPFPWKGFEVFSKVLRAFKKFLQFLFEILKTFHLGSYKIS